ncbi:acyltransferase family protein [Mariniflexile sp.]|uniref:acyltransferase family protein n=1 Tax=Mariniflexile sp. TaxID=1979402 RepID=UPI00356873DD
MERKNGIDLFRLVGAFFIMMLHTTFGDAKIEYVENLRLLSRWAVPFYFMASGYFIGPKIIDQNLDFKKIERNVSVLISILIVTFLVYVPISPSNYSIVNLLVSIHYHLWFIGALLFGYIFLWYIYFIRWSKILPFIASLILISAIISDAYDVLFERSFDFILARFLVAIPFLYIGVIISKVKFNLRVLKLLWFLIVGGFMLQFMEAHYLKFLFDVNKYTIEFTLGTLIGALALFVFSTTIKLKENLISTWGKDHSLFIYLYHPFLYFLLTVFLNKLFPEEQNTITIFFPVIGFMLLLGIAIFMKRYLGNVYAILNGNFVELKFKK